MLIHPWDAAVDGAEWRAWLATTDRFGVLAVSNRDAAKAPLLVPTHFTLEDGRLLLHLARPNPLWPHLEAATEVRLAVIGDYAYIPTYWRSDAGGPDEDGVPTSYYTAVQFVCRPHVIDDDARKAEISLRRWPTCNPKDATPQWCPAPGPTARCCPGSVALS